MINYPLVHIESVFAPFRYRQQHSIYESSEIDTGLVGHIHLNEVCASLLRTFQVSLFSLFNIFVFLSILLILVAYCSDSY